MEYSAVAGESTRRPEATSTEDDPGDDIIGEDAGDVGAPLR